MRLLRALLVVATVAVWALALRWWPRLPERIPMHFGLDGTPDRWAQRSLVAWFLFPAMATVFAVALGWLLPRWMRGLAAVNSPWLNVPDQVRFRALPQGARLRVVDAAAPSLVAIGLVLSLMFCWIVDATAQVAVGEQNTLPIWPIAAAVLAMIVLAVRLTVASKAAVRREGEPR